MNEQKYEYEYEKALNKNFLAGFIEGDRKKQLESLEILKEYRKSNGIPEGRYELKRKLSEEETSSDNEDDENSSDDEEDTEEIIYLDINSEPYKKMTLNQKKFIIKHNTFKKFS